MIQHYRRGTYTGHRLSRYLVGQRTPSFSWKPAAVGKRFASRAAAERFISECLAVFPGCQRHCSVLAVA